MVDYNKDFDLTCWYINLRRVSELTGNSIFDSAKGLDGYFAKLAVLSAAKDNLVEWLKSSKPLTLGQLILSDKVENGQPFTHYSNFYCNGLVKYRENESKGKKGGSIPFIYSKLDPLIPNSTLSIEYDPVHLTSESSYARLLGQVQLFVFGMIDTNKDGKITAIPYVIGMLLPFDRSSIKGELWGKRLEITTDRIDSFRLVKEEPYPSEDELELLKAVPEQKIKEAFAEILNEQFIPKDWGGERSDFFSNHVVIRGERIPTAFAFKGPAKFSPMTLSHLGKNGDQIGRLFSEPVDLVVLQHCHRILQPIREHMRAYATSIGNLKMFALIDGFETLRLLRAYNKCGFSSMKNSRNHNR